MKRWLIRGFLAAVVLILVAGAGFFGYIEALKRNWISYNEYDIRSEGILQVGDLAPDLELRRVGAEDSVRLSSLYRDTPLALVFGSYT